MPSSKVWSRVAGQEFLDVSENYVIQPTSSGFKTQGLPTKRRATRHGVTSQNTAFFIAVMVTTSQILKIQAFCDVTSFRLVSNCRRFGVT
jgi:hypothetical protein